MGVRDGVCAANNSEMSHYNFVGTGNEAAQLRIELMYNICNVGAPFVVAVRLALAEPFLGIHVLPHTPVTPRAGCCSLLAPWQAAIIVVDNVLIPADVYLTNSFVRAASGALLLLQPPPPPCLR